MLFCNVNQLYSKRNREKKMKQTYYKSMLEKKGQINFKKYIKNKNIFSVYMTSKLNKKTKELHRKKTIYIEGHDYKIDVKKYKSFPRIFSLQFKKMCVITTDVHFVISGAQ